MEKNIKIAKQLLKIAKELIASKEVKATFIYPPYANVEPLRPELRRNWKKVETYEQLLDECKGIDAEATACCLLHGEQGKRYFDTYGAPYYVYVDNSGKAIAIMHIGSHQIKEIATDNVVKDEDILRSAAGVLWDEILFNKFTSKDLEFQDNTARDNECTGDFSVFKKYYAEADEIFRKNLEKSQEENQ